MPSLSLSIRKDFNFSEIKKNIFCVTDEETREKTSGIVIHLIKNKPQVMIQPLQNIDYQK
jgi:hypothetical protein